MTINVLDTIAAVLKLPVDTISDRTTMKETPQWDSLKHMQVIIAIEENFNVQFSGDEIANMLSVSEIKKALTNHGVAL